MPANEKKGDEDEIEIAIKIMFCMYIHKYNF